MRFCKFLKHTIVFLLTFLLGAQNSNASQTALRFEPLANVIHLGDDAAALTGYSKLGTIEEVYVTENHLSKLKTVEIYKNADGVLAWRALAGVKLNLLRKLDNFTNLKTWVNGLDDVVDANLITKLDGLDAAYLAKLETDIASNSMGAGLKALLKESPDDLNDIWKILKDDPKYAYELSKTGGTRWEKWAQGNYFKMVTKAGRDFEELVCKQAFKNRNSAKYLELKQKFQTDFGKNLDDYEMFSQVQLKYNNSGDYFVADQIFIKYDAFGDVEDMVVIENKLSSGTNFTTNQTSALQSNSYSVRSTSKMSLTNSNKILTQNEVLSFDGTIKWYKVYSAGDGTAITGINKIN